MKRFVFRAFLLVVVMQASCRERKVHQPVFPVHGAVSYQGRPAEGARVSFVPMGAVGSLRPQATVGADGTFQLSTYELNDGAPSGRYAVAIVWPGPNPRSNGQGDDELPGPDRLNGRYSDPNHSPWQVEVGTAPLELAPFQLE